MTYLTGDEPKIIGECCVCREKVSAYEEYYDIDDDIVCDNCLFQYMKPFRKVGA